jgi:hypothetical protein
VNLNTLKDEKREDCCFVEEDEEAIVLLSMSSAQVNSSLELLTATTRLFDRSFNSGHVPPFLCNRHIIHP